MEQIIESNRRPYFFWDYDITNQQVDQILKTSSIFEKAWLINRILQYAKWEDIWRYLTLNDIRQAFDYLYFRHQQDQELWSYALKRWADHE